MTRIAAILLAINIAILHAAESFLFFEPIQPPRHLHVMAHRGAAGQAPENSRPALLRCIEDGVEWAEIDLRLSRDGQHVIAHGSTIGEGISVAEETAAELKAIDIGSRFGARFAGERLMTLAECFDLARGKLNLYLDCKAVNPEQLAHEILAAGMERQVVVYDSIQNLEQV